MSEQGIAFYTTSSNPAPLFTEFAAMQKERDEAQQQAHDLRVANEMLAAEGARLRAALAKVRALADQWAGAWPAHPITPIGDAAYIAHRCIRELRETLEKR